MENTQFNQELEKDLSWMEKIILKREHKLLRKRLTILKNILPTVKNKIFELNAKKATEQNTKKVTRYEKQISYIESELNKNKDMCIKSIMASSELFDIEDDQGLPITEKYLNSLSIEELLEQLELINNELEKITN